MTEGLEQRLEAVLREPALRRLGLDFLVESARRRYSYNFTWLGRPIIQYPQDIVAVQELIWSVRPRLIIETGIAHGGSLILSASLLELIGEGEVLGVDVEIRPHNRVAIEQHPLSHRITMIEGSSTDDAVAARVRAFAAGKTPVMLFLDSSHSHEHVLRELQLYSPLVTKGSYAVVFDTVVEEMPPDFFPDRPWGKGNNPRTAVEQFLATNDRFVVDRAIDAKLLITVAPGGYLRCMRD